MKKKARLESKLRQIEEQQIKKVRRLEKNVDHHVAKNNFEPKDEKKVHLAPHLQREMESKKAIPQVPFRSRLYHQVTWCNTKVDIDGTWSWNEPRAWTDDEWNDDVHPKFKSFSALTWYEIDAQGSESGHKMHHEQDFSTIHKEAQDRWTNILDLAEFQDDLFRFRLSGTKRVWGYILQAHFFMVWFERHHLIYKVEKK